MLVHVTRNALLRCPKECPVEVFDLDGGRFLSCNMVRSVAFVAGQPDVFSLEHIASCFVIKVLDVQLDHAEVTAVVVGMTATASLAYSRLDVV